MGSSLQGFAVDSPFLAGVAASFLGGTVATALGAASVFLVAGVSERASNAMLAFAAGAMLFVIFHEVIPETHRERFTDSATAALFVGFSLMMVLDTALA